jgi:hypothetical protein
MRYISLLLCGGLILTLYVNLRQPNTTEKNIPVKTVAHNRFNKAIPFSFYNDIVVVLVPALKS